MRHPDPLHDAQRLQEIADLGPLSPEVDPILSRTLRGRAAAALAALSTGAACAPTGPATVPVDPPLTVAGVVVPPDSLNAYVVTHAGFTSRGGRMRCAYTPLGQRGERVFLWALCLELLSDGDSLVGGSGLSAPVALTVRSDGGVPRVVALERPRDGDEYGPSVRRIFPITIWPRIFAKPAVDNVRARALEGALRRAAAVRLGLPPDAARAPDGPDTR